MDTPVIPKPVYRILSDLTQEPRLEVALLLGKDTFEETLRHETYHSQSTLSPC